MIFQDRVQAGEKLSEKLLVYKNDSNAIVIGLPRGGVVVAHEIAQKLNLPLDIIVSRKIGSPLSSELAIGAITESGNPILDQKLIASMQVEQQYIDKQIEKEKKESERRLKLYRGDCPTLNLKDKKVILVDDGIATGYTVRAAISSAKEKGAKNIILAISVLPRDVIDQLKDQVDQVIYLHAPAYFDAIGTFYKKFEQTKDYEVIELLGKGENL